MHTFILVPKIVNPLGLLCMVYLSKSVSIPFFIVSGFSGFCSSKVVEVVNADALVIKTEKGQYQKVFFSSFRPPKKPEDASETSQVQLI